MGGRSVRGRRAGRGGARQGAVARFLGGGASRAQGPEGGRGGRREGGRGAAWAGSGGPPPSGPTKSGKAGAGLGYGLGQGQRGMNDSDRARAPAPVSGVRRRRRRRTRAGPDVRAAAGRPAGREGQAQGTTYCGPGVTAAGWRSPPGRASAVLGQVRRPQTDSAAQEREGGGRMARSERREDRSRQCGTRGAGGWGGEDGGEGAACN